MEDLSVVKNNGQREVSNRFISSLQEVRKMMRRVSGTVSTVNEEEMSGDNDRDGSEGVRELFVH